MTGPALGFWGWLDARGARRDARRRLLVDKGLDWRSLIRAGLTASDPRFMIALSIIGLFGWAYAKNMNDDTMKGALIAGFAGAWGYYLGSSNTASRANDRADRGADLAAEALKKVPDRAAPEPDVTLEPGETRTIAAEPEKA